MRGIVDEGVPRKIVALLREHAVDIDPFPKFWKGSRNGRLLKLIGEAGYDWFLTNDKNMEYQQNLHGIPFSIIVLPTPALDEIEPNLVVIVDAITGLVAPSLIRLRFPVGGRER